MADAERTQGASPPDGRPDEHPSAAPPGAADGASPAPPDAVAERDEDSGRRVEADLDALAGAMRERDEYLELLQRTRADYENFRKRKVRDEQAAEARGLGRLARELLPALDNLQLALANLTPDERGGQFAKGIELVQADLRAALERVGIHSYWPEGERFDPQAHEAMAQQPVDGAESGTIVEVYQQGLRLGDQVLRPARVVVAR